MSLPTASLYPRARDGRLQQEKHVAMGYALPVRQLTDGELLAEVRLGGDEAFAELYRRHAPMARAVARRLVRSANDADDLAAEAFARILRALRNGRGPDTMFASYLAATVRNVSYDRLRRTRESPVAEMDDLTDDLLGDAAHTREEWRFAAAAFRALPERWRRVLWHTEVEGRTPAELGAVLGLAPNAVAALAYRAREGFRQAYVQAHLREHRADGCEECLSRLGGYVRDGLSVRDLRKVVTHLAGCRACSELVAELASVNGVLRSPTAPARGSARRDRG